MTESKIEYRKPSELHSHPKQAEIFGDLPPHKFRELVENMKKEGQKVPLEILPDGTVIGGHNRLRAARSLGWVKIAVIVRHDLAEAGEAAVIVRMIEDNTLRRQLTPLQQARSYLVLKEQELRNPKFGLGERELTQLRDQLGEAFDMGGRNVSRYLAVLKTPQAVQDAFDRRRLSLVQAASVSTLPKTEQAGIAAAIEADPDANLAQIVKNKLNQRRKPKPAVLGRALSKLHEALIEGREALSGREHEIHLNADELSRVITDLAQFVSYAKVLIPVLQKRRGEGIKKQKDFEGIMKEIRNARPEGKGGR